MKIFARLAPAGDRWWAGAVALGTTAAVLLGAAVWAGAAPSDSGTAAQLDRIDANAYGACVNAAGTNAARLARCTAPPTSPPATTPPATTTAPPTTTPPATTTAPPTTTPPATTTAPPTTTPPAGFPTAATTGVPAGTALATVNGDLHAAGGATIDARDIQGSLIIDGDNVHVTRTRIHGVVFNGEHTGTQLTDTEITANPGQGCSTGNFPPVTGGSYSLLRVHVHNWQDGPRTSAGTVTITDSLSDGLCFASGEHPDAVQQYGPGSTVHVTLQHNTLSGCAGNSSDKGNSALFWSDHPGSGSTLVLADSLLSCGQFTIRINDTGAGSGNYPNVVADVHGNTVTAGSYALGPAECANASAYDPATNSGVKWANNVLSTGAAIGSPCA
jgi:hypothetical protein